MQVKDAIINGVCRVLGKVYSSEFIGKLTGNADTATKATQDESGNNIKASYASSISISDHTITLKNKNDSSLGTVTVPDNNTWRPLGTTADTACAGNDSRLSNARPANGGTSTYANNVWTQSHNGSWYINSNWNNTYFVTNAKATDGNTLPIWVNNSGYADSAGNADTLDEKNASDFADASHTHNYAGSSSAGGSATSAVSVVDYGNTSKTIKIGFDGAGATTSNLGYIAGYLTGGTQIKDVNKDTLKSWLGLGSAAYTNSDAYAASSHIHEIADVTGLQTALDGKGDYETGTWTPTTSTATVSSYDRCKYTKIGKLVFLSGSIKIEPSSSNTSVVIAGLPFPPVADSGNGILCDIYTTGDNLHRYNSTTTPETIRLDGYGRAYFRIYDGKATSHQDLYLYMTYPKVNGTTIKLNVVYRID